MKIVLCCAGGMSTSLLMNKMKDAAKSKNLDIEIEAVAVAKVKESIVDADILLLGPQIKFEYDNLKVIADKNNVKIGVIDMVDYGMMKGDKVLEKALEL